MEESVLRAMARWPSVPAVYGWLSLDTRGRWLLKGRLIDLPLSIRFIEANYSHDDRGRWFFQNGPQRVYLSLALTPWIYRLNASGVLRTHTGLPVQQVNGVYLDEHEHVLLDSEHGIGVVIDADLENVTARFCDRNGKSMEAEQFLELLEKPETNSLLRFEWNGALVPVKHIAAKDLAQTFGFDPDPRPEEGSPS